MLYNFKAFERNIYNDSHERKILVDDLYLEKIAEFFGYYDNDITFLGSGSYGNAYEIEGENKILKLTSDYDEYVNATTLLKKNTKYIINYYDARSLIGKGRMVIEDVEIDVEEYDEDYLYDWRFYAIILDKVDKPPKEYMEFIKKNSLCYKNIDKLEYLKNYGDNDIRYRFLIDQTIELMKEAEKVGVNAYDLHMGNLGWKDNHLVYFDIGTSSKTIKKYKFLKDIQIQI